VEEAGHHGVDERSVKLLCRDRTFKEANSAFEEVKNKRKKRK
jgi:hypothetical protein